MNFGKRRSSMADIAEAITDRFGGAAGIADIFYEQLFSEQTTSATKAKILSKMADYLAQTSKQYGDRERLAGMSSEQIERRILQLLKKHNMVVPISGIGTHAGQETKESEAEGHSPAEAEGSPGEDRATEAGEDSESTGDMDG